MEKITLGVLAHVDAGKTTLIESMLYESHQIKNKEESTIKTLSSTMIHKKGKEGSRSLRNKPNSSGKIMKSS